MQNCILHFVMQNCISHFVTVKQFRFSVPLLAIVEIWAVQSYAELINKLQMH